MSTSVFNDLSARVRGFVLGFCLGDALASSGESRSELKASSLSRAFLHEVFALEWSLRCDSLLSRDAAVSDAVFRVREPADRVLAVSLPLALAILTRAEQAGGALSLVNGAWLTLQVDHRNVREIEQVDVTVAGVLVRAVARRLLGETTTGLDGEESLDALLPARPGNDSAQVNDLIRDLSAASRDGHSPRTARFAEQSRLLGVVAESVALLDRLEDRGSPTLATGLLRSLTASVAALALGLFGATHGDAAEPLAMDLGWLDVAPLAERAARSVIAASRSLEEPLDRRAGWVDPGAQVPLLERNRRWLSAHRSPDGDLVFAGQDLNGSEYEWASTVAAADVPVLVMSRVRLCGRARCLRA
ncbi:hypothetical protein ACT17Q_15720 [Cellulomonas sp. CW35]|uniref:hypothetical protein n=1 Tax=Cellulomonas sp. CW35 TaxID=3458249 RepID=UPI0040338FBD